MDGLSIMRNVYTQPNVANVVAEMIPIVLDTGNAETRIGNILQDPFST
jgi:hypothetical protein